MEVPIELIFYSSLRSKIVIQHLRTAEQRCEQFAVFSVLRLYIECVPISELAQLIETDNAPIIAKIVQFMNNPTIYVSMQFILIRIFVLPIFLMSN